MNSILHHIFCDMDFITIIRNYVEDECKKPTSNYGYDPFLYHFTPTVKYANQLVDELWWDKEVVTIAWWLHDIGSIICGRKDHHITGSEIAEKKLTELGYPKEKIELIKKCILNHRGSKWLSRLNLEEQIISDADAMSNFDNITWIFKAALVYEQLPHEEATESVKRKLQNKRKSLHFDISKEIIKPKYEAAMLLLS